MKCPHCTQSFHPQFQSNQTAAGPFLLVLFHQTCPECNAPILEIAGKSASNPNLNIFGRIPVYPVVKLMRTVSGDIPDPYRKNFAEAIQVMQISPNASALLSRRLLQAILSDKAETNSDNLAAQIEEAEKSVKFPSHIQQALHTVRVLGNIAAHPTVDKLTGTLWDVEDGEAELTLNIVESLLDFYFVQPALVAKQKAEINKKLEAAGKKPIP